MPRYCNRSQKTSQAVKKNSDTTRLRLVAYFLFFTRCDVICDLLQNTRTEKCNVFVKSWWRDYNDWLDNPVTGLITSQNRIGKITVLFNRVSTYCYSLANRQGLFQYVRTCKTRLDTTTKFMVVVTTLFNLVISSFPDKMFYHAWTTLLIYHDGSNNVVQVCSSIKP